MITATTVPLTEVLRQRKRALVRVLVYLSALVIETVALIASQHALGGAERLVANQDREIATLIAENRRLRGGCPNRPTLRLDDSIASLY